MSFWKNIFNKGDSDEGFSNEREGVTIFVIKLEHIEVGYLKSENNKWYFNYSDEFKTQDKYHRIVGFSNLDKTYESEELWPFFKVRIPGLKQPLIQEIIKKESIDKTNEVDLLKRFGRNNISNPYKLEAV
ncbi:HipA N-terminal domain-containing protein [Pseudozobellia sp. WGM2]|uniref:HipA N-terminal domain-containing protein n=1 Tax=Pseudozobellia sp. WGM2 TaxID=2787625 RepID=UPI001ADFD4E5|nr:HipA N-terminal domain-containing protein [Pseudozobellia sp. WGM2]